MQSKNGKEAIDKIIRLFDATVIIFLLCIKGFHDYDLIPFYYLCWIFP